MVDPSDVEPRLLLGSSGKADTQLSYAGKVDPSRAQYSTQASWYDTSMDPNEGAFCLVQQGSDLEELVGDVVQVANGDKTINVYCVGTSNLITEFALQRAAYFWLEVLNEEPIDVVVQAVVPIAA